MLKPKIIAFYLPQFHPIPENDKWWGKGFTEWTNVGRAKPLFKHHEQPRVPADLGYYDLRLPQVREAQAELAREAGVYGFCYWHYWFGNGKTILSEIFNEVLESGAPNFPFCLGWANHDWTSKNWNVKDSKTKDVILIKQEYPGKQDYINHFYNVLPAFKDKRYIRHNNKPIFLIYAPLSLPNPKEFIDIWNNLAKKEGLEGIFFIGIENNASLSLKSKRTKTDKELLIPAKKLFSHILDLGFNAVNSRGITLAHYRYNNKLISLFKFYFKAILSKIWNYDLLNKYNYKKVSQLLYTEEEKGENIFPTIIPNWDRSPRSGKQAAIWYNNSPEYFKKQMKLCLNLIKDKSPENQIIFLMSWNEWAEGNYLEPDLKFHKAYIQAHREALNEFK